MLKSRHSFFMISVFGGILVWLLIFLLFPADIVFPFSKETFWFIFFSYCCFILGYFIFPKIKLKKNLTPISSVRFIRIIILITFVSFFLRYLDLFFFRSVSFNNEVWQNRELLLETKPNFIFIVASILKQLYFVPIIFLFSSKIKDKKLLLTCLLLFLLPFVEGIIRASRNSFFMPVILLFITLLYFKKIKFNVKSIVIITTVLAILLTIATSIIMQREANETDHNYSSITTDFFLNKFLKPKSTVFKEIHSTKNQTIKQLKVSILQIAQYYVHGVFEFDNIIKYYNKKPLKHQYGKFTFSIINRFTNKYNLTSTNLDNVKLMNPRGPTFITFFGGLYIDFGWVGLFVMILYGGFQRFTVNNICIKNNSYLPLFLFFIFCNFFMLTYNFLQNKGTYIIVVCLTIIFTVSLSSKFLKKNN